MVYHCSVTYAGFQQIHLPSEGYQATYLLTDQEMAETPRAPISKAGVA
jgi:hypothetical protein